MEYNLAQALAGLTTGIYVLTVADGEDHHGMSSSWVTQVSGEPPLLSVAIDNQHFSNALVTRTRTFGLNIAGARGQALEDYFYSPRAKRVNNLSELAYELSPALGVPWLNLAMISIGVRVRDTLIVGDHTLFIGAPVEVHIRDRDRPLTSLDLNYVYLGGKSVVPRDRTGW
jgi:flavin reductase (DIM6/NTAB) family NADH-FMN oxidoreductase RutF